MHEIPTMPDFQVFQSRWKYFLVVLVVLWILGNGLYLSLENVSFEITAFAPFIVVVPVAKMF